MNERLKIIRKRLDLTQQKFADTLGMKQNTIAQYEMGRTTPSDAIVRSICREFNVNENWLRTGDGEMFIEIGKDAQLIEWTGEMLKGEPDSFKRKFTKMLIGLTESEWNFLEEKMKELMLNEDEIK